MIYNARGRLGGLAPGVMWTADLDDGAGLTGKAEVRRTEQGQGKITVTWSSGRMYEYVGGYVWPYPNLEDVHRHIGRAYEQEKANERKG